MLRDLFEVSPTALLPLGYALAQKKDLDGLAQWLAFGFEKKWKDVIGHGGRTPHTIVVVRPDPPNHAKPAPTNTRVTIGGILAQALAVPDPDAADPNKARQLDRPLSDAERHLVGIFLAGVRQLTGTDEFGQRLLEQALLAFAQDTDRSEAVEALLDAGALVNGGHLVLNQYGLTTDETFLNAAHTHSHRNSGRDLTPHFGAALAMARRMPAIPQSISDLGTQQYMLSTYKALDITRNELSENSIAEVTWLLPLSMDPSQPPQDLALAMKLLATLEPKVEVGKQWMVRMRALQTHLQATAGAGRHWDPELVDYLLLQTAEYRPQLGGPSHSDEEMQSLRCAMVVATFDQIKPVIRLALRTHCHPVLERFKGRLCEVVGNRMGLVSASEGGASPPHPDSPITPLAYTALVASDEQPFDQTRFEATVDVLREIGLLWTEFQPGMGGALHCLAKHQNARFEFVPRLLDVGLDPEAKDSTGKKPASYVKDPARRKEFQNLVRSWQAKTSAIAILGELRQELLEP